MANDKKFKIKNGLALDDNKKIELGNSSDLEIYHDASDSIINDNGTGSLKLQTGGSTKLEVYTTGIDVTGNVSATGDIILEGSTANSNETTVTVTDPTADRTVTIPDQTGKVMLWQQPWPDDPDTSIGANLAIGNGALSAVASGGYRNVAVGEVALNDLTTGDFNTAIGALTLNYLTTGLRNTAVGADAGSSTGATTVTDNTYIGAGAGEYSRGSYNTSIGKGAGGNTYFSNYTTNLGYQAGYESGNYSVNIGYLAGYNTSMNQGALGNICVGYSSGSDLTSGDYNTLIGYDVKSESTSFYNLTAGYLCRGGNNYNIVLGFRNGLSPTADRNIVIGQTVGGVESSSSTLSTSDNNVILGGNIYKVNDSGNNVIIGQDALGTGEKNGSGGQVALGNAAMKLLTSGDQNCGIGQYAGYKITTGDKNTYLGYSGGGSAGDGHSTGSNSTFLGNDSRPSSTSVSNQITLGNTSITSLRCNVTTISSLSDERDKTNIEDLPYGIDFINDMRPVQFNWNRRDGSMSNVSDFGFIAQDLHDVELEHSSADRTRLVKWDNPDKLEADYVRSYPILVKAVQELSAKCDALEARLTALEGV